MRIPFMSMFIASPFDGLQEHAEKVKECAWAFQQAIECHISEKCKTFEEFRQDVITMESEADAIKRRIRGHLPKGTLMPVDKFQLFRYLREQDRVLDAVEDSLNWLSYRSEPGIPEGLQKEFFLLVDANIDPIEELSIMVLEARKYFKNFSEKQRTLVKDIISLTIILNIIKAIIMLKKGEIIQLITTAASLPHLITEKPPAIIPKPIIAPTIAWVVETGRDFQVAKLTHKAAASKAERAPIKAT